MLQRFSRWASWISPRTAAVAEVAKQQKRANKLAAEVRNLKVELAESERQRGMESSSLVSSTAEASDKSARIEQLESENEMLQLKLEDLLLWVGQMQERMKTDAAISAARRQAAINNTAPPQVDY